MTGIVVGVGTVVLIVSAGRGAEKKILDRIRDMGTNLIVVNAGQTRIVAGRERQIATVTTLEADDAEAITQQCSSVALAAPAMSKKLAARYESENANTNVVGMTPEGFRIRNIAIASGRPFDAEENRARRRVAILGPTVVENLFGGADPIGLRIRIGRVPFEVVGVTVPKGMDANGVDQDDSIIVPLATAMRRLFNVTHIQTIYVQARSAELLNSGEKEIRELLRQRHRLRDKPDDFTIQNHWERVFSDPVGVETARGILDETVALAPLPGWREPVMMALLLVLIAGGTTLSAAIVRKLVAAYAPEAGWRAATLYLIPGLYGGAFAVMLIVWRLF